MPDAIGSGRCLLVVKCDAGDYASGIPVLEKLLTDARIPLPPRT